MLPSASQTPGAQPPAWAGSYVGIPFADLGRDRAGCDCWGLVRLVLSERAGLVLPMWSTRERDAEAAIGGERGSGDWLRIEPGSEQPMDVVEMSGVVRVEGDRFAWGSLHVGVVVGCGWLLHSERVSGAVLARYRQDPVKRRVLGLWRHRARCPR